MKSLLFLITLAFTSIGAFSQSSEFPVYPNGLIYSEQTMGKLSHIVDSLNLKFKVCDFNKQFQAKSQTTARLIHLDTGNIKQAKKDLEANISWDDFVKKYPLAEVESNVLVIRNKYKNYEDQQVVEIEKFDLKSNYGFSIESSDLSLYHKELKGSWLMQYHAKSEYSKESLDAFYFPESFTTASIPVKYSRMIGYSDCLVDTNSAKFRSHMTEGWVDLPENWQSIPSENKNSLLEQMRCTRVVGGCSQDTRPREHAVNIALLSAETANWEVFLKAHLDIMNDRFERVSDGSYAWGARNTYIRELEELNINVTDLILGITFRMENPPANHYFGSISRTGRALSESKNRDEFEQSILSIISDKELDHYNRLLFYYLFLNYNHYLKDEAAKKESIARLDNAVKTFPGFIYDQLKQN